MNTGATMHPYRLLSTVMLSLLLASHAHANLTIHPMRTSVEAQSETQIRVYSQSAQTQFVKVSIRRIDNAAETDEHEVDLDVDESAIAITPAKFALAAGGNRLVRVIGLHTVTQETAYRVSFESVRGDEVLDDAVSVQDASASLGVSIVWGALVNVLPSQGQAEVALSGGTLRNTGTLRMGITSISDCMSAQCTHHEVKRSLYPGGHLPLPFPVVPGHDIQLRYALTRDGYREHMQVLTP